MFATIDSWNWNAIGAAIQLVATLAAVASVWIALRTIKAANKDAETTRQQQKTRFQSTVISACMQEYFKIRRDVAKDWDSQPDKHKVEDLYSERVYGLHFEQYHLFRQLAIPRHVYTIWIKSLKTEIEKRVEPYPQLKIDKYIVQETDEDFNSFISKVLKSKSDDEIEALVKKEAHEGPYD